MATVPSADNKRLRFVEDAAISRNKPVKTGDILIRKMKTFIYRMDMDKDGCLTKKDFEILAERGAVLTNLDPARAKQALQQLCVAWDSLYSPEAVGGKLTAEKMAEALVRRGREMVIAIMAILFSFCFDILDVEKKGYIDKNCYRLFHHILNQLDEDAMEKSFHVVDENHDGNISYMEFVQAGIDFFLTNDVNSPYNQLFGPLLD